jgi:trk system potassium uptake protein TrkH
LNASVGGFDSIAVDLVVTFFMVVAGANFALHFQLFRGKPRKLALDPEFRIYIGILAAATVLIATNLVAQGGRDLLDALRLAVFQATSIVTTTGFATDNFATWPNFAMVLLFLLMFIGGCAGSTGGSVKVVRNVIVFKKLGTDLRRMIHPHAVLPVRLGDRAIPDDIVTAVTTFFILFLTLFTAGGLSLVLLGLDPLTSFSASATCLANVGPGFGLVGPDKTYELLPDPAKLILIGQMIIGRLEIYTILVLLFLRRRV